MRSVAPKLLPSPIGVGLYKRVCLYCKAGQYRAAFLDPGERRSNSDIICRSSFQAMSRDEKFIDGDRKIAHTLPGRVINRVSNCCWDSGYTDFAGPTSSNWIENRVRLTDKMDIDVRHVGVSSH